MRDIIPYLPVTICFYGRFLRRGAKTSILLINSRNLTGSRHGYGSTSKVQICHIMCQGAIVSGQKDEPILAVHSNLAGLAHYFDEVGGSTPFRQNASTCQPSSVATKRSVRPRLFRKISSCDTTTNAPW